MTSIKHCSFILIQTLFIYLAINIMTGQEIFSAVGIPLSDFLFNGNTDLFPLSTPSFYGTFLFFTILLCVIKAPQYTVRTSETVFCVLLSFGALLSKSFAVLNSWDILFSGSTCRLMSIVALTGSTLLARIALRWIKKAADRLISADFRIPFPNVKHRFLITWGILFLCYLPYIILRYPAGIESDAYYQIEQFLGYQTLNAHHPPFSTLLMGSCVLLGNILFDSNNAGIFFFVLIQSVICTGILSYTLTAMERLKVPEVWRFITLLIYAIAPIFAAYLTSAVKDALFSCVVLLFVTLLAELLFDRKKKSRIITIAVTALFMCLLRKNGIYILYFCIAALLIYLIIKRKKDLIALLCAMLIVCGLSTCYQSLLLPALGIPPSSVAEALSVPFQQTARYVRDYPNDVTEEEAEVISAILDYDNLADLYDPTVSDPVKSTYHGETADLKAYFSVWFKQFLRHPGVYFEAALNTCAGFYNPSGKNTAVYTQTWSLQELKFYEPQALDAAQKLLLNYVEAFDSAPVLMLIETAGFHCWIVLYLLFTAVSQKNRRMVFLLIPSVTGILVCLASPTFIVNGVRYALPYIYCNPFLIGLFLAQYGKGKTRIKESEEKQGNEHDDRGFNSLLQ